MSILIIYWLIIIDNLLVYFVAYSDIDIFIVYQGTVSFLHFNVSVSTQYTVRVEINECQMTVLFS